jgi:deoxyadenosine/deoxycytidine kinase
MTTTPMPSTTIRQALSTLASTLRGSPACDDVRIHIQDGIVSGMTSTPLQQQPQQQPQRVLRSPNVPPIIISVDGNIGAGKSTIISQLKLIFKDMPNVHFIHEPVDTIWNRVVDESGETLLSNFYKNPAEHAFTFQVMAYISRLSILAQAVKSLNYDVIITERCLETDRNVFEKMLHDQGLINKMEHTVYNMWFDEFYRDVRCSAFIYVQASVDTCMQRIKLRSRDGETISRDYIAKCVKYHEDWIMNDTRKRLIVNADSDSIVDENVRDQKMLQIVTFIHSLCS